MTVYINGVAVVEGAVVDFFDKYRQFITWANIDGFTVGGDSGFAVTASGSYVEVRTGSSNTYDSFIQGAVEYAFLDTGKVITVDFPIVYLPLITSQTIWLRFATGISDPPSATADHIGWKIMNADLYTSVGDGSSQTIVDTGINLSTGFQRTRLKMVFTPGTDCKFYVDDVLKETTTTNLPDGAQYSIHFHVRTLESVSKKIYVGRVLIEKEHA